MSDTAQVPMPGTPASKPEINVFKPMADQPAPEAPQPEIKTPEVPKEEVKKDEFLSPKFAALAKKERELLKQQQELKEKLQRATKYDEAMKGAKQNPLKILEEAGISYDDVTKYILNDNKPTESMEVKTIKEQMEAMKKELESERAEREKIRLETQVLEFKSELTRHIHADPEKYPLVRSMKGEEIVYNVIEQHFNDTGEIMPHDAAADLTEKYYRSQIADSLKNPELKKYVIQELGLSSSTEEAPSKPKTFLEAAQNQTQNTKPAQPAVSKTLTNQLSQDAPRAEHPFKSREESIANAARMIRWE